MGVVSKVTRLIVFAAAGLSAGHVVYAEPTVPVASCKADRLSAGPPSLTYSKPTLVRTAAQVSRNKKADLTFATRSTPEGVEIDGHGGDLAFRKTVRQNGSFTLDLEARHDQVSIDFSGPSVTVKRGKTTVTLGDTRNAEDDLTRVHKLLADSPAIALSRVAAAAVLNSEDDSAESASVLLSDAMIGALTGDPGAPARAAKHLSRHLQARLRKAVADCYGQFESMVWNAFMDYEDCAGTFGIWDPLQYACSLRYFVMAESYWFQFVGCLGVGSFF
jgi:hypothetical protein